MLVSNDQLVLLEITSQFIPGISINRNFYFSGLLSPVIKKHILKTIGISLVEKCQSEYFNLEKYQNLNCNILMWNNFN